jgi:hypothetical protein
MARIDTVNREPTPIQAAAYGTADLLLAGGPGTGPLVPPGKYTTKWIQIATLKRAKPGKDWAIAADVIDRFLAIKSGQKLVDEITPLLKREGARAAKIDVHFTDHADFPGEGRGDAAGYFGPDEPGEPLYDVYVQWEKNMRASEFIKPPLQNLRAGKSRMAHSLFHEILHVWFIHAHPGEGTGHVGERMHPEFGKRLDAATKDLEKVDKRP